MSIRPATDAELQQSLSALVAADPRLKTISMRGQPAAVTPPSGRFCRARFDRDSAAAFDCKRRGHADAWPAGDLALQEAVRMGFVHPACPTEKRMMALAEPWRPWRGVAAYLLWAYYRARKGRDVVPVQPLHPSGNANDPNA
jgi:hypothetical protein